MNAASNAQHTVVVVDNKTGACCSSFNICSWNRNKNEDEQMINDVEVAEEPSTAGIVEKAGKRVFLPLPEL